MARNHLPSAHHPAIIELDELALAVIESTHDQVDLVTADGRILYSSHGSGSGSGVGNWWDRWPPEVQLTHAAATAAAAMGTTHTFLAERADGSGRWEVMIRKIAAGTHRGRLLVTSHEVLRPRDVAERQSEIARIVAVELKNPVRRLRLFAEMVLESVGEKPMGAPEDLIDTSIEILSSSTGMATLLDRLEQLSRGPSTGVDPQEPG